MAPPHVPPTLRSPQEHSEQVKLRRGVTFLAMTLLLPGSAQLAAGHRGLGRVALRIWVGLWVVALLAVLLALTWRNGAIALFTFGPTLRVVQVGLVLLAVGWAVLLADAWRLARPPELAPRHRLGFALLSFALIFAVIGGLVSTASVVSAQRDLMATVFAGGGDKQAKSGRYNILLMGGDAGKSRVGLRPDSMTVASVDAATGRTVLISLPRNLEDVPFPESSPLHEKFPDGYTCADHSCMLNAIYTYATENRDLYPGVKNPGAQATKEAIEGATGLTINYWVLIDLKGFEALVDAVGGITMDVYRRVPIGGGSTRVTDYVEAGKGRHLDGREALWFARSRSDSSDYDRIVRQKCVMSAMLAQMDPVTVLTNFNKIAAAGKEVVATDIPTSDLSMMTDLALKARALPVSSVAIMPPLIQPGAPDFDVVRQAVAAKIGAAEAADLPAPTEASSKESSESSPGTPSAAASVSPEPADATPTRTAQTDDLTKVCSA